MGGTPKFSSISGWDVPLKKRGTPMAMEIHKPYVNHISTMIYHVLTIYQPYINHISTIYQSLLVTIYQDDFIIHHYSSP